MNICKAEGCGVALCKKTARGFCRKHYRKLMKYGDPLMVKLGRPLADRFQEKISKKEDGCWEWTGRLNKGGYGIFTVGHTKKYLAHRYSWESQNGAIMGNLCCLHKCDNPKCVNVEHLFIGTRADNLADMREKGRGSGPKGEAHPKAKLTSGQVRDIRARFKGGVGGNSLNLANEFGVSRQHICLIFRGRSWSHV